MDLFSRLNHFIYAYNVDFVNFMASEMSSWLPMPSVSFFLSVLWFTIFMLWFFEGAISVSNDSKLVLFSRRLRKLLVSLLVVVIVFTFLSAYLVIIEHGQSGRALEWMLSRLGKPVLITFVGISLTTLVFGWYSTRYWMPAMNHWVNEHLTKKSYHESGVSDIRDIDTLIPKKMDYDPVKFWKITDRQIFFGLDPNAKPIYIPLDEWNAQHQQVLGTTGFGKGVVVTNQLSQCLAFGQTVVVLDPKNDEWAPSVLLSIAEQYERPVCIIDLNDPEPQLNPLYGTSELELYDLFIGAFGLAERGGDADFYRSKDRRVVQMWQKELASGMSLIDLANSLNDADFENAPKLCNDLTELAMLGSINTRQKGDWYDVIDQGGLVYIIGSIRREPVLRLQKMFLLRLMQRLEKRDRRIKHTHVSIFLDEFKYLLCKPSLQALGTIRDKFANILLAHQSIDDLRDVPADLDPDAVKSAVLENTALKLVYRSQDPETAEWIAKRSGTIRAHREMREISTNEGFSEVTHSNRRLQEIERYLIEPNIILRLPKRCGILFSSEIAQIVLTSPTKAEKREISPSCVDPTDAPESSDTDTQSDLEAFS